MTVTTRPDRRELTHDRLLAQSAVITADSTGESGVAGRGYWPIRTSETKAWSLREKCWAAFHRAFKCHVFRIAIIKPRITIPEMQSRSKEAGSRSIKYRRRCGLCGSDLISQLYQRFHERGPMLFTTRCTTVWRFEKIWCRVSDIATNKNRDFTSGFITLTPNILNTTPITKLTYP